MTKDKQNRIWLSLIFVVATAIVVFFMPRDTHKKYIYERNRPWNYSLLTAPFDITIYRDSATVAQMTDSVRQSIVPIFNRLPDAENDVLRVINESDSLSAPLKQSLRSTVKNFYSKGIVTRQGAYEISSRQLNEVRFRQDNRFVNEPTSEFLTQRQAYLMLDSIYHNHPDLRKIQALNLGYYLEPNIEEDTLATKQYFESVIQPIVSGIGVIQKGERIIAQGDIVTPQLYQVLKTYESTLEKQSSGDRMRVVYTICGQTIYVVLTFFAFFGFLYAYYPRSFKSVKELLAMMLLIVTSFVATVLLAKTFRGGIYIVPMAIIPIIINVFFDSRVAFFSFIIAMLLTAVFAAFQLEYIFIETIAASTVLLSMRELSRRSELLRCAAYGFIAYVLAYLSYQFMTTGSLHSVSWRLIGFFGVNAVLISFAYILIFVFEKVFGMISVVTLVELSDINNKLLRKLSMECPGTFQHSMAVSNLATDAAHRIGANMQLVRAGALYHDIGKTQNPAFFTENQHSANPHDLLNPMQSASIITGHVTDGLKLAEKAKLPKVIRDLIAQHHGKGKAKYFYTTYCRDHEGEDIDPTPFEYPGPNPQTREASLLMMADAVEAASRSMKDHTVESITELVNKLIDGQVAEGLHNESSISFRDIKEIKQSFINRLRSMYHARVSYPAETQKHQSTAEGSQDTTVGPQNTTDNGVK